MIIQSKPQLPVARQLPGNPPPPKPTLNSDEYLPTAKERCQAAVSKLGAGLGAVGAGLGVHALGLGVAGSLATGVVGALAGYVAGRHLGAKIHGQEGGSEPLSGAQWVDPAPSSPANTAAFRSKIGEVQNTLLSGGKLDHIDRGFHQKQLWGGKAHVEFDPNLPAELRGGSLSQAAGQDVTAAVRFSNGQGCPFTDARPDVRGLAVKMNLDGKEVDLLATNHVTFARNAAQFMRFAEIAAIMQTQGPVAAIGTVLKKVWQGDFKGGEALRIATTLVQDTAGPVANVGQQTYWTQAMHVGDRIGRFVFTPESGAESKPPLFGKGENHLRDNLEKDLEKGDVTMRIGFEAFTEDSVAGDASQHGEHITLPVGRLVIDGRSAQGRELEEKLVSKMAFNPGHGFALAGTMNESNRVQVYEQSAKNRGALDWSNAEVQKFFAP